MLFLRPPFTFKQEEDAMRRKDREVTDQARIQEIVARCKVCRLGLSDEGQAYIVPLNFGHDWEDGLTLYFHSAREGRKLDILNKNPRVCFEMDIEGDVVEADNPCSYGYTFASIMGEGKVEFIEGQAEKAAALEKLMVQQTGRHIPIPAAMTGSVCVYKVKARSLSCKARDK